MLTVFGKCPVLLLLHLHKIMERLYFYFSLSICLCVCVCLSVRLWTKCRSNRYTDFDVDGKHTYILLYTLVLCYRSILNCFYLPRMHRVTTTATFSSIHNLEKCYHKLLKMFSTWLNCLDLRLKTDIFCLINLSRIHIWPSKWIEHNLIFWESDFSNKQSSGFLSWQRP